MIASPMMQSFTQGIPTIVKLPEEAIARIAAGEVVTKPVNVVKELLENSLDAGSTNIRITIEQGGLKLIEIVDNGHGIARMNAELLCCRYSTSKLRSALDLPKISTFGFRGEALASISEMADIEVRTFNMKADHMGWQARYKNGALFGSPSDKYLQHSGTQLKITNLFSTLQQRKRAMQSSFLDEKKSIIDLVMRYAIHHGERVTMSLKESNSPDLVCVLAPIGIKPCVGQFFGLEMQNNFLGLVVKNDETYKAEAQITFSYKRSTSSFHNFTFILFINDRLVQCPSLKKEVEAVVADFLSPKQHAILAYISLKVPAQDIDVNMHPAKATVSLHYESEIIPLIVTHLRQQFKENLVAHSVSSSITSQKTIAQLTSMSSQNSVRGYFKSPVTSVNATERLKLLAPACLSPQTFRAQAPVKRPHDNVHNDSSQQTLAQLSSAIKTKQRSSRRRSAGELIEPWPGIEALESPRPSFRNQSFYLEPHSGSMSPVPVPQDQDDQPPESPQRQKRNLKLRAIHELKQQVSKESSKSSTSTIKNSTFVGILDHERALIQHETMLFAINLRAYLKEQYYQLYLYDFGNFPPIEILPPGNKMELILYTYLEDLYKHDMTNFKKLKFSTPDLVIEELLKHSSMLDDYLSLKFTTDEIQTIPCIMPDEIPNLVFLGRFLVNMANQVDYTNELECFKGMGRVVAEFYSEPPANLKDKEVHKRYHELVESKLYVAIKNYLLIPEWLFTKENICQISDTKDLYKVFERC